MLNIVRTLARPRLQPGHVGPAVAPRKTAVAAQRSWHKEASLVDALSSRR